MTFDTLQIVIISRFGKEILQIFGKQATQNDVKLQHFSEKKLKSNFNTEVKRKLARKLIFLNSKFVKVVRMYNRKK